jgi:hypothetical protein
MSHLNLYNVKDGDRFYCQDYPFVVSELEVIVKGLSHIKASCKGEAIISYFKDRCLSIAWAKEHKKLTQILTSRLFKTDHIEFLFESCRNNKGFRKGFEDYITNDLFSLQLSVYK